MVDKCESKKLLIETMNVDNCFNDRCLICSEMNFNMLQDMKTVGKQKSVDVRPLILKFLNEKVVRSLGGLYPF